jgi:hypothetical protein
MLTGYARSFDDEALDSRGDELCVNDLEHVSPVEISTPIVSECHDPGL